MQTSESKRDGQKIILGLSGASGALYGLDLLNQLEKCGYEVHLLVTEAAAGILQDECGINEFTGESLLGRSSRRVLLHDNHNMVDQLASGSFQTCGMVICPCSMHSLSAIAGGLADNLLLRSAYVTLKQRRPLILVSREMPLTDIDLQNMLTITRCGGIICPACPAYYNQPQSIIDLVHTVTGRVLDLLGIGHDLRIRWQP